MDLSRGEHALAYLQLTQDVRPPTDEALDGLRDYLGPLLPYREMLAATTPDQVVRDLCSGPQEGLMATFKFEDVAEDGEWVGPLYVDDLQTGELVWQSEDWMRESEARKLAETNGWHYDPGG